MTNTNSCLFEFAENGLARDIKTLVKLKADPNLKSKRGLTPLQIASAHENLEAIQVLTELEADPNLESKNS